MGDQVEAVWLEDKTWYLATITKQESSKMYEVCFTEYGNSQAKTPVSCIRPVTPEEQLKAPRKRSSSRPSSRSKAPKKDMPSPEVCKNCGKENPKGFKFCKKCGTPAGEKKPKPPPKTPAPKPAAKS